jgi:hypothetical protein
MNAHGSWKSGDHFSDNISNSPAAFALQNPLPAICLGFNVTLPLKGDSLSDWFIP